MTNIDKTTALKFFQLFFSTGTIEISIRNKYQMLEAVQMRFAFFPTSQKVNLFLSQIRRWKVVAFIIFIIYIQSL